MTKIPKGAIMSKVERDAFWAPFEKQFTERSLQATVQSLAEFSLKQGALMPEIPMGRLSEREQMLVRMGNGESFSRKELVAFMQELHAANPGEGDLFRAFFKGSVRAKEPDSVFEIEGERGCSTCEEAERSRVEHYRDELENCVIQDNERDTQQACERIVLERIYCGECRKKYTVEAQVAPPPKDEPPVPGKEQRCKGHIRATVSFTRQPNTFVLDVNRVYLPGWENFAPCAVTPEVTLGTMAYCPVAALILGRQRGGPLWRCVSFLAGVWQDASAEEMRFPPQILYSRVRSVAQGTPCITGKLGEGIDKWVTKKRQKADNKELRAAAQQEKQVRRSIKQQIREEDEEHWAEHCRKGLQEGKAFSEDLERVWPRWDRKHNRVVSLNVCGLNDRTKQETLALLLGALRADVVLLQETKMETEIGNALRVPGYVTYAWSKMNRCEGLGDGGGMILIKSELNSFVRGVMKPKGTDGHLMALNLEVEGQQTRLINVYYPTGQSAKKSTRAMRPDGKAEEVHHPEFIKRALGELSESAPGGLLIGGRHEPPGLCAGGLPDPCGSVGRLGRLPPR